jgi:hypothetical protein
MFIASASVVVRREDLPSAVSGAEKKSSDILILFLSAIALAPLL